MHSAGKAKNVFRAGSQAPHRQTHSETTKSGQWGHKKVEYSSEKLEKAEKAESSQESKSSSGVSKGHHKRYESSMRKTKTYRHTFSIDEKITMSENINILQERSCQLISKKSLLEFKMKEMEMEAEKPEGDKPDLDEKVDEINKEFHKIHMESLQISKLTKEILNPRQTPYKQDEVDKFHNLVIQDSRVEEARDNSFKSMIKLIKKDVQEALNTGNDAELIEHERKLAKLYQKKIEENTEKLNILNRQPFSDVRVPNEIHCKIYHLQSEIKKFKELSEELTGKISLQEEISTEFHEVEVLHNKFEQLDRTIGEYEQEFPKSSEIQELSIKRKSTKNKLEAKLEKVVETSRALHNLIKNSPNVNSKELENADKRYEKLEGISNKLHEAEEKQIKKTENTLKIKSLEKKLGKVTDDFSKKIAALTDNWDAKSTPEKEEALKQLEKEYESYSSLWEKETGDAIANICNEHNLSSHELSKHEALKGVILSLIDEFKKNGTVDRNLIYILKKTTSNSAILSTSLLKKISKMSGRVLSTLAITGIALAIYMYTVFKKDEENFKVAKANVSDYETLLNQVDSLLKYRKAINEALNQDKIPLTDAQIAEYNQTVEEFKKIKDRMKKLDDFFTTPSLSKKIDIGDKLAHKIYQVYPNALIDRDESSNEIGAVELLRNPWASKKVIEDFRESGETIFHNKVDAILAESGLYVDTVVDMSLPEEINFRKAYSAHAGIAASTRLIEHALKYDTQVLENLKASLFEDIRDFEEKTKSHDESRYFASWRGRTDEFEAMEKGQKERTGTLVQHREIKRKKAARKEEIARQIEKKTSHQ